MKKKLSKLELALKKIAAALQAYVNDHIADINNPHGVTKTQIGLENVTNDAQVKRSEMGAASGVATLGTDGKVPSSQLPSYVDDVLEYAKLSSFPATGESGKIYVAQDTNKTYRWSGSAYVEISPSIVIGTTTGTAADGKIANDHYSNTSNPHGVTKAQVGLGSVVNTGDSATPVSGGTTKFTTGGAYTELAKKVDKVSGKGLSTNDYTDAEKNKLSGIASGAEVNQNAFSNVGVKVGNTTTTVAADAKTDTVTLIQGSNVTLTADTTNDTITIAAKDTTYSSKAAASGGSDVSLVTTGEKYIWNSKTSNTGTVTSVAVKMNGATKGTVTTSGTIDLGTVLTSHQDISGKADKTTTVNGHALSGNVTVTKSDVGLGNVGNFKAVSTVANQGLTATEQTNARTNIAAVGETINTTWANLKNLRDNSQLIPGQWYRITDYECTTAQQNTQSAGHAFDVIVRADDVNVLNENAYAALHSGDTYFANSKLEAWQLKYCLDNDDTRFAWADSTNGKGVIYYMKDEFNNECAYDFKNIQFKRYRLSGQNGLHLADYPMEDSKYSAATQAAFNMWKAKLGSSMNPNNAAFYYTKGVYKDGYVVNGAEIYDYSSDYKSYDNGDLTFDNESEGNYVGLTCIHEYFDVIAEVADTTGEWFYTFSEKSTTAASATDASMGVNCYENSMKAFFNGNTQSLNDNIFIAIGNSITAFGNSFDTNCYNNTFGYSCNKNTFGDSCYNNTFGYSCNKNTFGNSCYNNSFDTRCYNNSFGNSCCNNSFDTRCGSNTFGSYFQYNSFGNYFQYNSFGNNCYNNSFDTRCGSNTFGNSCCNNSFGNYSQNNSFGNTCKNIIFKKDYCYNNIVENGNQYIELTSTQTTSSSNLLRNITIAQGVNNSTTVKTISHNTVNDTFKTTYQPQNSQIVSV